MNTLLCAGAMTKGVRSEIGFRINALLLDAGGSHADPVVPILLALVVLTLAAVLGGRIMTLMKQPAVLGELLVGLVIGNLAYCLGNPGMTVLREGDDLRRIADLALSSNLSLSQAALRLLPAGPHAERIAQVLAGAKGLDYLTVYSFVDLLSRIAILVLLFLVGLETSVKDIKRVGKSALYVAVIGVVAPLALGMGVMKLLQPDSALARDLFVGGILTATSVGITARVLRDLRQDKRDEARVILGAAVLDDVLSLIVLAVVSALALTGKISVWSIGWTTTKATVFLAGSLWIGIRVTPWAVQMLARAGIHNVKLLAGWIFAFFVAWLANGAGLATIVGAFAAGMILNDFFDKEMEGQSLQELLSPVESLVVPLFFVWMGIQVKLEALANRDVLLAGLALTLVAIVGKAVSGVGCPKRMNRLAVGFGMMPRGEVGLIFAGIGKSIGVVDDGLFSAVVVLVMITTLLAPVALRWTLGEERERF
jgi:Kef-type K+ transport system membrane component KefB